MAAWNALKEGVGSVPEFFSGNLGQPALSCDFKREHWKRLERFNTTRVINKATAKQNLSLQNFMLVISRSNMLGVFPRPKTSDKKVNKTKTCLKK